ncbi:MAG TPA: hypothetical protein VGZ28_08305 [Terriglobales bacterium]|jgi:hypothetical protein|nr:hypothetical protein [Terriglobales bacterium]
MATEKSVWKALEDHVEKERKDTSQDFYPNLFPPHVSTVVPVEGSPLSKSVAASLQANEGAFVFVMSIFLYRDNSGEYGLEDCVYTQGGQSLPRQCETGHNQPTEFRTDHWWNK